MPLWGQDVRNGLITRAYLTELSNIKQLAFHSELTFNQCHARFEIIIPQRLNLIVRWLNLFFSKFEICACWTPQTDVPLFFVRMQTSHPSPASSRKIVALGSGWSWKHVTSLQNDTTYLCIPYLWCIAMLMLNLTTVCLSSLFIGC